MTACPNPYPYPNPTPDPNPNPNPNPDPNPNPSPNQERPRKKQRRAETELSELSAAQRETLAHASGWLDAMRTYLASRISEPNLRNVMRVTTALASGAG